MAIVPQSTVGWSEPAIFIDFGRHIFGTLRLEANIIMHRHKVGFPATVKRLTLSYLEMPVYAKICYYRRLDFSASLWEAIV